MKRSKVLGSLFLLLFCVSLAVGGQALIKLGLNQVGGVNFSGGEILKGIQRVLSTPYILIGLALYVISAFFWLEVLSRLDMSFAYPLVGIGYVVSVFVGAFLFKETVTSWRVAGVLVIALGAFIITRS